MKAAEILARALENDADAHDRAEFAQVGLQLVSVQREVLPINDIPRPVYKLAMRFWREWQSAAALDWPHHAAVEQQEWPALARIVAEHLRLGRLPNNARILDGFVRRPHRRLLRKLMDVMRDNE